MQANNLISHFDKTYTFGGFSVGLTISEDSGCSDADIFIIRRGEIYQCNFYYADGFTGDVDLELESSRNVITIRMPESVQTKLKDWLYANGY